MTLSQPRPEAGPSAHPPQRWRLTPVLKNVAIFGGDGAARALAGDYEPRIAVQTYDGTDSEMAKLVSSLKAGTFTHVIVLSRWIGHSKAWTVRDVAKRVGVRLIIWPRGLGSLKAKIPELVRDEAEKRMDAHGTDEDEAPPARSAEPVSVLQLARNAGRTVACFQERHGDCGYRGKLKIKCGCSCHALEVVEVVEPTGLDKPVAFAVTESQILDVVALEPAHGWTIAEIASLLDAATDQQRHAVDASVAEMITAGVLVFGEVTDAATPTSRRVTLPDQAEEKKPASAVPAQAPVHYAVLSGERVLLESDDVEAAKSTLETHHGSRLFREVRTRRHIEVLDG